MALFHKTITFDGTAQNVKTAAALSDADDLPLAPVTFQEDVANGAACFVGSSSGLTSSIYMLRLPAGASGLGPVVLDPMRPVKPSEIWVLGTANQKIHVGGVIV